MGCRAGYGYLWLSIVEVFQMSSRREKETPEEDVVLVLYPEQHELCAQKLEVLPLYDKAGAYYLSQPATNPHHQKCASCSILLRYSVFAVSVPCKIQDGLITENPIRFCALLLPLYFMSHPVCRIGNYGRWRWLGLCASCNYTCNEWCLGCLGTACKKYAAANRS